jgi:PAS domain-containing protein
LDPGDELDDGTEASHGTRRVEEELRRRISLYETLLEAQSASGKGLVLLEEQRIVYAKEAFSGISGYGEAELTELPSLFELIPSESRDAGDSDNIRRTR